MAGRNPYDDFRGRPLISERAFEAGGMYSLSKMVEHTFNDAGFSQFTTYDDRRDTTFEAMLKGTPFINSMFRIVKTSDYGLTEKAMAEVQKDRAETARRNIKRDEFFEKRLKGIRADQLGNLLDENGRIKQGSSLYRNIYDISLDLYSGEPTKEDVQTTAKAFIRYALKEQNNPYVKSVLNAQSNDTKVKILQEAKNELPVAKYNEMALRLRRTGIVSKEVFRQIK